MAALRALIVAAVAVATVQSAVAQTAAERRESLSRMIPKHEGYLGALAPENLNKQRPAPPFNLTGTWFVDLSRAFGDFRYGPPYPEFIGQAKADYEYSQTLQRGQSWRDAIGQCFPAGQPMVMTRVWPIAMVQLPTVIFMTSEFMNSLRVVYMDGRPHSEPDVVVPSFNGESIGRWDGDTLVIDTKYFVGHHHWIDSGIPISDAMHMVERIRKINNGQTLEIEFAATDPKSWEGEWKWTKRWNRVDDRDIAEVSCFPDLNDHMPSTRSKENIREGR